jgi:hypothetical protein
MTEAAQEVAQLKSKLHEASRELAQAQERARQAADKLISDPTPENQADRNAAEQRCELISLQIEQARRQLKAAEVTRHQEAIAYLGAEHGEAQGAIGDIWSEIERATGVLEGGCERAAAERRGAQKRTGRARQHHALAGLPDEERPSFMIALPKTNQVRARLQKVIEQLQRLEIPNW